MRRVAGRLGRAGVTPALHRRRWELLLGDGEHHQGFGSWRELELQYEGEPPTM